MLKTLSLVLASALAGVDGDVVTPGFTQSTVLSGLSNPTAFAFLPDGRILVTEQGGALKLVDGGSDTVIFTVPVAFCFDYETGVLGIVVDPDFATNGFVYLYRTKEGAGGCFDPNQRFNEVIRITIDSDDSVDPASLTVLLTGIRSDSGYHNGGALRSGLDGSLFVGVGETGTGDFGGGPPGTSTNPYAQDPSALEGKILRINLDGTIPLDNPYLYAGVPGARPEVYAVGFRNPWRLAVDPVTRDVWVGDVGEEDVEEIDRVPSVLTLNDLANFKSPEAAIAQTNFGWPLSEAKLPKVAKGTIAPVFSYPHEGSKSLGTCVSGLAFAPGTFGFFQGVLFFGDFDGEKIYRVTLDSKRKKFLGAPTVFATNASGPVDIGFGPDGSMYYLAFEAGQLRKISGPPSGGVQLLAGKSLSFKFTPNGEKNYVLAAQGADQVDLGGGLDNPIVAGASLRFVGNGFDEEHAMPAEGWKFVGKAPDKVTGYQYKAPDGDEGFIRSAQIIRGKLLKVSGFDSGSAGLLDADPSPISIVLTLGTRKFGMTFGGETKFTQGKSFTAKDAPAPGMLPP